MTNKYPQISFVFDRRKIASPTRQSTVEMRICYNYEQKYLSTGIKLYSNQWKNGKIVNCPDMMQISQTLNSMLTEVRQAILEMMQDGNIDINLIQSKIEAKNTKVIGFIDFCNQRAEIRKYGKRKDSQERYNRFLKLFGKAERV